MEKRNSVIKILLIWILILFPCFSIASWKDSACKLEALSCSDVSKNYTEPFCVTSVNGRTDSVQDINQASHCITPSLTNKLSSDLKDFSVKDVVEKYCLSLFWKSDSWRIYFAKPSAHSDGWDRQQTFDSHQSIFLHALCSSFTKGWDMPFINENDLLLDVLKWDVVDLLKLKQMSKWKDLCSLEQDTDWLADCDMAIYATKIFEGIMRDLFKIKYAQVLDVNTSENFESEKNKKVEDFMSWYYFMKAEKHEELKQKYPKTISVLESNQRYYKNVLDSLKIIDNTKLADMAKSSWCPVEWNMSWMDFVACALHSSQWDGFSLTPSFLTLFYNELLHYRHFVAYYQEWAAAKISSIAQNKNFEKDARIFDSKMLDFKGYFDMQMEASEWVQRDFENFSMTYPLYIWLLLYIEKVENFRSHFAKIITPFYSLSEKLQNVQLCPS